MRARWRRHHAQDSGPDGVDPQPLDGGEEAATPVKKVAFIHEDMCIGCTKCIQACPVDAILGATKAMHTVIAAECTGATSASTLPD